MSKIGHTLGVTENLADISMYAEQLDSNFFQIFLASPQKGQATNYIKLCLKVL